ncbi:Similar to Osteoclast-stimulating factor 1; acc. no. Q5ZJJ9 [Pyronema omphalodes CBS 100304]|uniref:Similar to Osteoclast-stimulating factor 1 acc. no. Q5ZJJ9 n=1 Tax=Pyronema omphalodes (strain CBS 100304) TaxID=1076935 RepID=U4LVC0_PYROM|nr:Similar to Osteoclast-stimulating factor 1; acc. no. Q5ZJJ9 [Pyronema omphalodes CBS 100304]
MEQIALFIVPGSFEDEVDEDEDDGEDEDREDEDREEEEDEREDEDRKDRQEEENDDAMWDPKLDDLPLVDSAKFFEAAKSGDIETVNLAVMQEQIDINAIDKSDPKNMALMHACNEGHENIVKLLLGRADIQVNKCDKYGDSALKRSCVKVHINIVKLLLERKDI